MQQNSEQLVDEPVMETVSIAPPPSREAEPETSPEERAFTGHPDHPPSSPDQPVEGNQELIRQGGEDEAPNGG